MLNHESKQGTLTRSAASLAVIVLLLSLTGCNTPAPATPRICPGIVPVSRNGADYYAKARAQYALIRAQDLRDEPLNQQMTQVLRQLDGAITNDPRCMLFHTKQADMLIEAGQGNKAQEHYETARKICEDWVPSWIGLADLATRNGAYSDARSYLKSAQAALDHIAGQTKSKEATPDFFAILGINIPKQQAPGKSPDDPSLSDDDALRLVVNHLQESEAWTIENPGLLIQGATPGTTIVQSANLTRRLRARIEYQTVLIRLAEKASPADLLKGLDYVLQWDADFFPAKIETAVQLRATGNHQEAERILRPYVDSSDPKLANNGRLLFEMASIYTDWFKQGKDSKVADLADEYFDRLHKVNARHAEGYVKRAELYLAAGTLFKRPDTLKAAIHCLDQAKSIYGKDDAAITALRGQIAKAQAP
jgi:tetratricopeptide (TPR) repeat protein